MFSRTALRHDFKFDPSLTELDLKYRFGEQTANGWFGISYYKVRPDIEDQLRSMIPSSIIADFDFSLMVINRPEVPAHIDNEILISINFYIDTADAVTRYHTIKDTGPAIVKLDNQTDGMLFLPQCLDPAGEFTAKSGEVWILDVKQPHSVSCKSSGLRVAYCAQSRVIDFDTAVQAFGL